MALALLLSLVGQQAQTEWLLPTRSPLNTRDMVQRIDDIPRQITCYVAREAGDKGIAISCLHSR